MLAYSWNRGVFASSRRACASAEAACGRSPASKKVSLRACRGLMNGTSGRTWRRSARGRPCGKTSSSARHRWACHWRDCMALASLAGLKALMSSHTAAAPPRLLTLSDELHCNPHVRSFSSMCNSMHVAILPSPGRKLQRPCDWHVERLLMPQHCRSVYGCTQSCA